MTAAEFTALARNPGDCTGILRTIAPRRPLTCIMPAGHAGGHVYVSESSAPDRRAG